jgi:hypothetical protein
MPINYCYMPLLSSTFETNVDALPPLPKTAVLTPIFQPCAIRPRPYLNNMELSLIQNFAIQARVAAVIGATVFDRVFAGVRFAETDGPLLYVYAKDEQSAGEIEDDFSLLIADIASRILKREVELVVVLPKVLQ